MACGPETKIRPFVRSYLSSSEVESEILGQVDRAFHRVRHRFRLLPDSYRPAMRRPLGRNIREYRRVNARFSKVSLGFSTGDAALFGLKHKRKELFRRFAQLSSACSYRGRAARVFALRRDLGD